MARNRSGPFCGFGCDRSSPKLSRIKFPITYLSAGIFQRLRREVMLCPAGSRPSKTRVSSAYEISSAGNPNAASAPCAFVDCAIQRPTIEEI